MKKIKYVLFICLLISLLVGCSNASDLDSSNEDKLVVSSFEASVEEIGINNQVLLTVEIADREEKDLKYEWNAKRGEISGQGNIISYQAPNKAGEDEIRVTISDENNQRITYKENLKIGTREKPQLEVEEENSWFSLDYPDEIRTEEDIFFSGRTSDDVVSIKIEVDGHKLETADVDVNNNYSLSHNFSQEGEDRELLVSAFNESGKQVAAIREPLDVIGESRLTADYPKEIYSEERMEFSGEVSDNISSVIVEVDGWLLTDVDTGRQWIPVKDNQYNLTYIFESIGENREVVIKGISSEGYIIKEESSSIDVLEKPWFSINYDKEVQLGEVVSFTGKTSNNIEEVRIFVDEHPIGTEPVNNNQYKLEYTFSGVGSNRELKAEALNQSGDVVASNRDKITIQQQGDNALAGRTIAIDPGHGGSDSGAVGYSGYQEKDFNLTLSMKLKEQLEQRGANIVMTRTTDRDVSLTGRAYISNSANADFFISVHANSHPSQSARGTETFHDGSWRGRQVAQDIQQDMLRVLVTSHRRVERANFTVLTRTNAPAILIEAAFLSNPTEERLLRSKTNQQLIAKEMTQTLVGHFE